MPNTTYGSPYAQSSDLVSNWPGVSLNIADRIDDVSFKGNGLNDQTGTTYTLVLTDAGKTVTLNNASAVTVTVPTNASVAYETGTVINFVNKGAGVVTISPSGGVTLDNSTTLGTNVSAAIQKIDTNTWVMTSAPVPGLNLVSSSTFSAASSVNINNVFTTTYDSYRVIYEILQTGAVGSVLFRMRLSGTDAVTNYSYQNIYGRGSTLTAAQSLAQTSGLFCSAINSDRSAGQYDVTAPALARATQWHGLQLYNNTNPEIVVLAAFHSTATAYDGFSILPSGTATLTGTIRIYGYRNS